MIYIVKCALAAVFAVSGMAASAATITGFTDGFEGEAPTGSVLNYNAFTNWDVTDGTVDLIKSGGFGITCQSGSWCVDMDGSTSDSGIFTTKNKFAAGSYVLSFGLSGNQRGAVPDTIAILSFGDLTESITLNSSDPWATYTRNVNLTSAAKLSFENAGGDNFGIILDNVNVRTANTSVVPLPAGFWLMGIAIGSLALTRRKAQRARS